MKTTETVIEKHGYRVTIINRNTARVEDIGAGVLPHTVTIRKLLGQGDANPKTAKNKVPTMGLSLLPERGVKIGNLCPMAKTCVKACLAHQGQGPVPSVKASRAAKSVLWFLAREWFLDKLDRELTAFRKRHKGTVGVRLNMFSDIRWEDHGVIDQHPNIQFYDYTKLPGRHGAVRPNYWVTLSYDGTNRAAAIAALHSGHNVSAVFHNFGGKCGKAAHRQELPKRFLGFPVIDGGETDWRPGDARGVIVGLRLLARTYASRNEAIASKFSTPTETANDRELLPPLESDSLVIEASNGQPLQLVIA